MQVAVQLYSLRSVLEPQLDTSLDKLASIGYRVVETAGMYGLTAAQLRQKFEARGLSAISSHVGLDAILGHDHLNLVQPEMWLGGWVVLELCKLVAPFLVQGVGRQLSRLHC